MSRLRAALRPTVEHLLGVGLVALAASPWLAVTDEATGLVHLGGAVAGASALSLLVTRLRRTSASVEILLSGVGLAAFLLLVVVADPLGGSEVLRGLRDGIPRILSTGLPLLDVAWAGVPGALVVWCTAGVVTSTVARRRSVAWPLLATLACFLGGYSVTLGGRRGDVGMIATREALLLALLAGVFTLVRGYHRVPEQDRSLLITRFAGAVLTILVAVGVGAIAADRGPFVAEEPVRPRLEPAAIELEPEGPLLVTRRLRADEPDRPVGAVTVAGDWSGYVPIAVLDRYDGRVWSRRDDRLVPTGGSIEPLLPVTGGPEVVVRDLDVTATSGWLPYVGRVELFEGVSVLHGAGEVFRLADPVPRASYRIQASQPTRMLSDGDLDDGVPTARSSGLVRPLEVVRRPNETRAAGERVCRLLALTATGENAAGGELAVRGAPCGRRGPDRLGFLRALADEITAGRALSIDAEEGVSAGGPESLADLLELVGPPSAEGVTTGAPAQFAAAFALIADHYGVPVRLVTGFRIEDPTPGGTVELHGGDAWTWAEVAVDGAGWVVVDPTPSTEDATEPDDLAAPDLLEQPDASQQEAPAELGVEPETVVVGPPPPPEVAGRPDAIVIAAVVLAVLVLGPLLVASIRRASRRWRRRRGAARARLVGAWHELLDVAHDVDVPEVESHTTGELVTLLGSRAPRVAVHLAALGPMVDRAVFSSRPVTDEDADRAWAIVRGARRDLRRSVPRRTRVALRWRVAPRSVTAGRRPVVRRRGRRRHAEAALADRSPVPSLRV